MYPFRAFVGMVEDGGPVTAADVTLLVHGTLIEGKLVPSHEYEEWLGQVISGAVENPGLRPMPPALRLTPEEITALRTGRAVDDLISGEVPSSPGIPEVCYLRDALVRSGPPMYWKRLPYLVVTVRAVSAYTLGVGRDPEPFGLSEPEDEPEE